MKYLKNLTFAVLTILLFSSTSHAQKKIGVFIHGFNSNGESWDTISEVPETWENNGLIDTSINLDYGAEELHNDTEIVIGRFIQEIQNAKSNNGDEFILVGHSLGGILTRYLYPELKKYINVKTAISIGGPMQGAHATLATNDDVEFQVNRIRKNFEDAYEHEAWTVSTLLLFEQFIASFNGTESARSHIDAIPDYLEIARKEMRTYTDLIDQEKVKESIGPNGKLIEDINLIDESNSLEHPQNYLSVFGAEKEKTVFRMAGYILEDDDLKDENSIVDQVKTLRNKYFSTNEGYYRQLKKRYKIMNIFGGYKQQISRARYKEKLWGTAKNEIDDIDKTWAALISSYTFEAVTINSYYVPECSTELRPGASLDIVVGPNGVECSTNPGGERKILHTTLMLPDKNDGVVNVANARWSDDDTFDDNNNIYMRDTNITPNGDDGGYNHFELRNAKRAYTHTENGQVVFQEGDDNPPMEEAADWLDQKFN